MNKQENLIDELKNNIEILKQEIKDKEDILKNLVEQLEEQESIED